jgi:flagellar hook protein FlgE
MGIQSSMFSGVSGLNANGNALTVIGNNIANNNTIGFKSSRTVFSDMLSATVSGSGGASQVGRGVNMSTVDNIFSQGTFENTESNTDLAIEGPGFFMVSDPNTGSTNYTRAGAFNFNEDGALVNPEGYSVQGYYLDPDTGDTVGDVTDLVIETKSFAPANPTSSVTLSTNLNSNSPYLEKPFDINEPSETSNYASSVRLFDSLGKEHLMTTYFNKLDPAGNPEGFMQWETHTVVSGEEVGSTEEWVEVGRSILTFDTGGRLVNQADKTDTIYNAGGDWQGIGTVGFKIDVNGDGVVDATDDTVDVDGNGTPGEAADKIAAYRSYDSEGDLFVSSTGSYPATEDQEPVVDRPVMTTKDLAWTNESNDELSIDFSFDATQYASASDIISQSQDGFATGTLVSLSIDGDGNILGNYSNGEPVKLARIALAKFSNPLGLDKAGNNMYTATDASGTPVIGTVGSGVGKIFTNSLEMSNVDLAQEFVKMITTQRGFQANSKIITTTDELLGELINLKR